MSFSASTFFQFFLLSALVGGAFAVIGAPIKVLLRLWSTRVGCMIPGPVLGMAVVMVSTWYWGGPYGAAAPMLRVLFIGCAIATVLFGIAVLTRPVGRAAARTAVREKRTQQSFAMAVVCFAGIAAIMTVTETQLFIRDNLTVITGGNNDAPSYAYLGQHVLDRGPDTPGNIAGFDAGVRTQQFGFGSYAVLAGAASFTDLDVWRVMHATLTVSLAIGAYALALLLRAILGDAHGIGAAVCAVLGYAGLYVTYLVVQWFFAQLVAIAFVFSIIGVLYVGTRSTTRSEWTATVAVIAMLFAGGLALYPHMTVSASVVMLPVAAIDVRSLRGFVRRGLTAAALFASGVAIGAALAPGLVSAAIDHARDLADVEAGWPLPSIYPSELLGFQTSVLAKQGWGTVGVSVFILAALGAIALVAYRRGAAERAIPLLVGAATIYLSYVTVFHREGGPTYRQWKWITFFTPFFVAAVCASVLLLCSLLPRPASALRAGYTMLGAYGLVALLFSTGTAYSLRSPQDYLVVTLDNINVRYNDDVRDLDTVHVKATPYWETMWLAYFLRDTAVTLDATSYYPSAPAPAGSWSLQRTDQPVPPGAEVRGVNDTYILVRSG